MLKDANTPCLETRTVIEIMIEDEKVLNAVYCALLPETKKPPTERSKSFVYLNETKKLIIVKIASRDLTSLRASINSYFKWLSAIINSLEVLENGEPRRKG